MSITAQLQQIQALYQQALAACRRADAGGKEYVGFRRQRDEGVQLVAAQGDCGGKSSARLGLDVEDWASNILYRLQDEGCLDRDLPLDVFFLLQRLKAAALDGRRVIESGDCWRYELPDAEFSRIVLPGLEDAVIEAMTATELWRRGATGFSLEEPNVRVD